MRGATMRFYLTVFTAMLLIPAYCLGSEAVQWTPESRQIGIESATRYWIDTNGNTGLSEVLRRPDSEWRAIEGDSINHGYVDEPYWFRVEVTNPSTSDLSPYLEIGYPVLDEIEFHAFSHNDQPMELAARFGGEEFVVVLPDTNVGGARKVAERIRRKVEETLFTVSLDSVRVTVSIGISSRVPDRAEYNETLFEEADQALYQAKAANRNRVVVHQHNTPEMGESQ